MGAFSGCPVLRITLLGVFGNANCRATDMADRKSGIPSSPTGSFELEIKREPV